MKLYRVVTVTDYRGREDVNFVWFIEDSDECRPYAELIENYDPSAEDIECAEAAIDEFFTEAQATAVKEYLDREHGDYCFTAIEEVSLPIANNSVAFQMIPVSGGGIEDFYSLSKEETYDLLFKTCGYFNLEIVISPEAVAARHAGRNSRRR